jgi:hypothetical protein
MYVVLIERSNRANKSLLINCSVVSFPKLKETGIHCSKKISVGKKSISVSQNNQECGIFSLFFITTWNDRDNAQCIKKLFTWEHFLG